MPYLNLDLDYFSHPKVMRLVGLLGHQHVAIPIRLWCYVAKYHCATGMLEAYSVNELESVMNWTGEPGQLVEALTKIKFIDKIKNGYKIHDWMEHAGHLSAFKKRAKTAAKKRWSALATSNATSTLKGKITNTPNLPNLPNLPSKKKSEAHAMPDDWSLTDAMQVYAIKKGMTMLTIAHQFEHCRTHHAQHRFTAKGWSAQVWQTWVLNWISFGAKQVTVQSIPSPSARCAYANQPCEHVSIPGSKYCQDHRDLIQRRQYEAKSPPELGAVSVQPAASDVKKLVGSLSQGKAMLVN